MATLYDELKLSSVASESVGGFAGIPAAILGRHATDIQTQQISLLVARRRRRPRRRHFNPLVAFNDAVGLLPVQRQRSVAGSFTA